MTIQLCFVWLFITKQWTYNKNKMSYASIKNIILYSYMCCILNDRFRIYLNIVTLSIIWYFQVGNEEITICYDGSVFIQTQRSKESNVQIWSFYIWVLFTEYNHSIKEKVIWYLITIYMDYFHDILINKIFHQICICFI